METVHYSEFAQRIRDKFRNASGQSPYDDVPDDVLSTKFVQKFPAYHSQVDFGMDYSGHFNRTASTPQMTLPGGRIAQAPAVGVFPDPVSPESMGAPSVTRHAHQAAPVRPPVAVESTAVRVPAPAERPVAISPVWAEEQARRAQMAKPTLTTGQRAAQEEREMVRAHEAEYQDYVKQYDSEWEADKRNRSGRAILDYRLSSGKRPLTRDEFARVRAGYVVPEAWIPGDLSAGATRERTALQAVGEASEFLARTAMAPVIRAIDAAAGVAPGFADLSHASNVRRNFETQAQVQDLRKLQELGAQLSPEQSQYLAENDPGVVAGTVSAVKEIPGMVEGVLTNPEQARQLAEGMVVDLPLSMALSAGFGEILSGAKNAAGALKMRNVAKSLQGRVAAGKLTSGQAEALFTRFKQSKDGLKAIEEAKELYAKRGLGTIAKDFAKETAEESTMDAVAETVNGQGRGENTGLVENFVSGLPLDAAPFAAKNAYKGTKRFIKEGRDPGLSKSELDAVFNGNLDLSPSYRAKNGLPVAPGVVRDEKGNVVMNTKEGKEGYALTQKAGSTATRPQVEALKNRPNVRQELKQLAALARNPETAATLYRMSDEDLNISLTEEQLQAASYGGREAGEQTVRGFAQELPHYQYDKDGNGSRSARTVATIGKSGGKSTVAHETIHGIENRLRTEAYGSNPSPESARLVDLVDDWTERAYEWGRKNGVILPGPKELLTQAMTYRLGWNADFDPVMRELPVPDELVRAFAARAGEPVRGKFGLRNDGTKMDDMPLPEKPVQQEAQAEPTAHDLEGVEIPELDDGEELPFSLDDSRGQRVQTRRDMTADQRQERAPWDTQDVQDGEQIVRFSLDSKGESDRPRLRVTHNLDADKLESVDKLGGFARPSMAIMRADQPASGDFGDITMVGKPHLGDPKYENIHDRDVYSPRIPSRKWKVNKKIEALADAVEKANRESGMGSSKGYVIQYLESGDRDRVADYASSDPEGIALFLKERGELPAAIMQPEKLPEPFDGNEALLDKAIKKLDERDIPGARKLVYAALARRYVLEARRADDPDVKENFNDLANLHRELAKTGGSSYLTNALELIETARKRKTGPLVDSHATRQNIRRIGEERKQDVRAWWKAKLREVMPDNAAVIDGTRKPFILDNVVDAMKGTKAKEKGMTFSTGHAKALAAKQFRDVEEMRDAAMDRMSPKPEKSGDGKDELLDYASKLAGYSKYPGSRFSAMDYASEAIGKLASGKVTEARARTILSADHNPERGAIRLIMEAANSIKEIKTDMFEGKPTRAVYFDEFGAAVVPDDVSDSTIELLKRRGISRIEKYKRGDTTDRTRALNSFEDLQFSLASEAGIPEGRADDPKVMEAARKAWAEKGVESPWFKRWFGDSKVVGADGRPLVVYHGTSAEFNTFSADRIGSNFSESTGGSNNPHDGGFFFSSRRSTADSFAENAGDNPRVVDAYLSLRNPYIDDVGDYWDAAFKVDNANFKSLRENGHDGMVVRSPNGSLFVAFSPTQIKSATGNRGTFDGGDADIRYSMDGVTDEDGFLHAGGMKVKVPFKSSGDILKRSSGYKSVYDYAFDLGKKKTPVNYGALPPEIEDFMMNYDNAASLAFMDAMRTGYRDGTFDSYGDTKAKPVLAVRIGRVPEHGSSYNYREDRMERGLSVIGFYENGKLNEEHDGTYKMFNSGDEYLVHGYKSVFSKGSDGEPLLLFPREIGKLDEVDLQKDVDADVNYSLSKSDPRQKILSHVTKAMRANGLRMMAQNDLSSEWRTFSKKAKTDNAQHAKEVKAWDAVEESLRQFVADNPTIAAEAGLNPMTEGHLDEFDVQGTIDQFRVWTNSSTQGDYSREELDHFAQARDAAQNGPESVGQGGHPMTKRSLQWLAMSKEHRAGGSVLFDSMGEKFKATWDGKAGTWIVKPTRGGDAFQLPRDGSVWIDGEEAHVPEYTGPDGPVDSRTGQDARQVDANDGSVANGEEPETWWQKKLRRYTDSMLDMKKLESRLKNPDAKPYREYDLANGRTDHGIKTAQAKFIDPALKIMKNHGITQADVDDYLYARHAKNVNTYVRTIREDMDGGSGMSDAEADEIMGKANADAVKRKAYEAIGELSNRMNKWRMDLEVKSGLRSEADALKLATQYPDYVPLRGLPDAAKDLLPDWMLTTDREHAARPDVVKGKVTKADNKKRLGRKSRAESVFAQNLQRTIDTIVNAQRNMAGRELLKLAAANPDKLYWEINPKKTREILVDEVDENGVKSKNVVSKYDPRMSTMDKGILPVWVDGKAHYLEMKTDEGIRFAEAIKGTSVEHGPEILRHVGKVMRVWKAALTSKNPMFTGKNFIRDTLMSAMVSYSRDGGKVFRETMKGVPGAAIAVWKNEAGHSSDWDHYINLWKKEGGQIGFSQAVGFDQLADGINSDLANLHRSSYDPRKAFKNMVDGIELVNSGIEAANRLAYFRALVDSGVDAKTAASKSKELTVNFNRKGDVSWVNTYKLFFNANVQGKMNLWDVATNPQSRGRFWKVVAPAMLTAGAGSVFLGMGLGGEDEDSGRGMYDRLKPYEKSNRIVVMDPRGTGKYITIPLPYDIALPYQVGRMLAEAALREGDDPTATRSGLAMDAALEIANVMLESFNPSASRIDPGDWTGSALSVALPSVVTPLMEVNANKNFAGRPVFPENRPGSVEKPESDLYYPGVNPVFRRATDALARATGKGGENEFTPGTVEISPEKIEHIFNAYGGGLAKLFQQGTGLALTLGEKGVGGVESRQIPFVSDYAHAPADRLDRQDFDGFLKRDKAAFTSFMNYARSEYADKAETDKRMESNYAAIVAAKAFGGLRGKEGRLQGLEDRFGDLGLGDGVNPEFKGFYSKAFRARKVMEQLQDELNDTTDKANRAELRRRIEQEAEKAFEGFGK